MFYIDEFPFIDLTPAPPTVAAKLLVQSRAGVDGVSIWHTGTRGETFAMQSVVNVPNAVAGHRLLHRYQTLIGKPDPVRIMWAGDWLDDVKFFVLDVRPLQIKQIALGIGGVGGGVSYGLCRCQWICIQVDPDIPEPGL